MVASSGGVYADEAGDAHQGVVTFAPGELLEGIPLVLRRGGKDDLGQDLVRGEHCGEHALEEIGRLDPALAARGGAAHAGLERQSDDGELGGRVGMSQASPQSPAIADLGVGDERHGLGQERDGLLHLRIDFEASVACHRADGQPARRVAVHVLEVRDPVEVDEDSRLGDPEVHRRDEALSPGQELGLATVL